MHELIKLHKQFCIVPRFCPLLRVGYRFVDSVPVRDAYKRLLLAESERAHALEASR